jgi:hypothetical protein
VRVGFSEEKNEEGLFEQGVWICNNWENPTYSNKPKFFNYFNKLIKSDKPVFDYTKRYTANSDYYPLPDWISSMLSCQTEIELINFKKSLVLNSFTPSGVLQIPTNVSDDQVKILIKKLTEEYIGSENAGKIMVIPGDKENPVTFTPFSNSPADRNIDSLLEQARQDIIMSHRLTSPSIIGLPNPSNLASDGNTIEKSSKEFFNKVVLPLRTTILTKLIDLFKVAGYETDINIVDDIIKENEQQSNQEALNKIAKFGSAGLQALTQTIKDVAASEIPLKSGLNLLQIVYGFTEDEAKKLLNIQ